MKLCVVTAGDCSRLLDTFKPVLAEYETTFASLEDISSKKYDALLLVSDIAYAIKALPRLLNECAVVYFAPQMPLWPLPLDQLREIMDIPEGKLRFVLPELFTQGVISLKKALNSHFVGPVGTVNLLRAHPMPVEPQALIMQEFLVIAYLLGGAQEAFIQHNAKAGKEAAFLSLQMESGALVSLSVYAGINLCASRRYDYACRDGVISYDSAAQPLHISIDGQESYVFPGEEASGDVEALRLAWAAALNCGEAQNKAFFEALHVTGMMEQSIRTQSTAKKGVGA